MNKIVSLWKVFLVVFAECKSQALLKYLQINIKSSKTYENEKKIQDMRMMGAILARQLSPPGSQTSIDTVTKLHESYGFVDDDVFQHS